ncbi:MAG: hypothetical protein PWQ45_124 [Thermosipho sp. (in: thermotogales)]|jgi:hypothetical protein|nr:hypothetical protein [Thermosipho sp. (in: thermotogales)]
MLNVFRLLAEMGALRIERQGEGKNLEMYDDIADVKSKVDDKTKFVIYALDQENMFDFANAFDMEFLKNPLFIAALVQNINFDNVLDLVGKNPRIEFVQISKELYRGLEEKGAKLADDTEFKEYMYTKELAEHKILIFHSGMLFYMDKPDKELNFLRELETEEVLNRI